MALLGSSEHAALNNVTDCLLLLLLLFMEHAALNNMTDCSASAPLWVSQVALCCI